MFGLKISYLPKRLGERYASALSNVSFNNKVHKRYGKIFSPEKKKKKCRRESRRGKKVGNRNAAQPKVGKRRAATAVAESGGAAAH